MTMKSAIAALLLSWFISPVISPAVSPQSPSTTAPAQSTPTQSTQSQPQPPEFILHTNSDLVLTNVVVRDKKTGEVIPGLKANDFTILENGKPQSISSFDFESVDQAVALNENTVSGESTAVLAGKKSFDPSVLRNHRLIVIFFDLSSMQPEDIDRAVDAAKNFVNTKMAPADLVAAVSLATGLNLDQDFTDNKTALLRAIGKYNGSEGQGLANGGTDSTTNGTADTSADFTPDETEYNAVNTDRKLYAIAELANSLPRINEKKSLLYFSGGLTRTGIENQASLRAATNAAVRANLSIYSVDATGLDALPPVGDASTGSLRGSAAYNGVAVQNQLDANFQSQETLSTLSADTGGKAFFDANDFAPAFQQIQHDTSAYYVLGFTSTNPARDGSYRRLTIKINRPNAKIEYRPGYYAPADFKHANSDDRERQLADELSSDLPATDVAVYMQALYFRLDASHFYVPVSLIVPGSQIPFVKGGDRSKATLDIIGKVSEADGHAVGNIRDTVKLAVNQSQQPTQKNIQYSTGFTLTPGTYHVKFVVRENLNGQMGSFETDIHVPDFKKSPLKMSSVVLASQRVPSKAKTVNPLVRDGLEWVPNIAQIFRQEQHLYFLYEVYDPAKSKPAAADSPAPAAAAPAPSSAPAATPSTAPAASKGRSSKASAAAGKSPARVLTSIEFLQNGAKVYETPLVEADSVNEPDRGAIAFQFDVPLAGLAPGLYTCQINVIDDAGGTFSFPRVALMVRAAQPPPAAPGSAPATAPGSVPAPTTTTTPATAPAASL